MLRTILFTVFLSCLAMPLAAQVTEFKTKEEVISAMGLRHNLSESTAAIAEMLVPGIGFVYAGGVGELRSGEFIIPALASVAAGVYIVTAPTHTEEKCVHTFSSARSTSFVCKRTGYTNLPKIFGIGMYLFTRAIATKEVMGRVSENNKILRLLEVNTYYNDRVEIGARISLNR